MPEAGAGSSELQAAVRLLAETGTLPRQYHPHRLLGRRTGQWECHIKPDWLMVWEQNDTEFDAFVHTDGNAFGFV